MNVKKLKELLNCYDDNLEIVRIDNSLGYERIDNVAVITVRDNFTNEQKEVIALS